MKPLPPISTGFASCSTNWRARKKSRGWSTARATRNRRGFLSGRRIIFSRFPDRRSSPRPYREAGGKVVGVVGVIGPTRLNYARIVPMVDFTAQTLSRLLK